MGFFELSALGRGGGGMRAQSYLCVITPMIITFGTDIKLDVFYTIVTKRFVMSLRLRNYDAITCILADA